MFYEKLLKGFQKKYRTNFYDSMNFDVLKTLQVDLKLKLYLYLTNMC